MLNSNYTMAIGDNSWDYWLEKGRYREDRDLGTVPRHFEPWFVFGLCFKYAICGLFDSF